MLEEVLAAIELKPGDRVLDCTLGGANYTARIAESVGPGGQVVSLDLDPLAIEHAREIISHKELRNVELVNGNFHDIGQLLAGHGLGTSFQAIVMDLGLSSAQLDDRRRGFSFQYDAPLDMSFGGDGAEGGKTEEIINIWSEREIRQILQEYGEEPKAAAIAKAIRLAREQKPIKTSGELLEIIKSTMPAGYIRNSRTHFATRSFQALRIATNDEIEGLRRVLPELFAMLAPGGRLAAVSFHSLEDRIIKEFGKEVTKKCVCPPEKMICDCDHEAEARLVNKKPITASEAEIKANPRSRSAKLRVIERL